MDSKDIEIARMSRLSNWTEIDNMKGYYRYVVAAKVAYEIIVTIKVFGESDMDAIANAYVTGDWHITNEKTMFERELIIGDVPLHKCLELVIKDYKENMK